MTSSTGTERKQPNVVVVLCDQLRSFSVGCWGDTFARTPHIDGFASTGFRFELGVTNCPACTPARSTLLASQHARTCVGSRINEMQPNGTILGRDDRLKFPDTTLAEEFKKLGYTTAQIGKWHVDTRPSRLGFDRSLIVRNTYSKGDFIRDEGEPFGVPGFTADYELAEARRFFRDNKSGPFFLFYNILSPHMPLLDVPYKYSRMYDPSRVPLRDNVSRNGKLPADERWFQIYMWETDHNEGSWPVTATAMPDFTIRDLTALYYGSVSWTDDLLGELMAYSQGKWPRGRHHRGFRLGPWRHARQPPQVGQGAGCRGGHPDSHHLPLARPYKAGCRQDPVDVADGYNAHAARSVRRQHPRACSGPKHVPVPAGNEQRGCLWTILPSSNPRCASSP